jgi:hypothetical protein
MTPAAARASAAAELRTAASIRCDIAEASPQSPRRPGMFDAHRDCLRTARFCRELARLLTLTPQHERTTP